MDLETEAIALGTLYKLLEMRLELQLFTLAEPQGAVEHKLDIWIKVLCDVVEKASICRNRSLLYYKIWLISRGLYTRVKHVKKVIRTHPQACHRYYATLHDRPVKQFTWGNTKVQCLQDAINLAYLTDHHCCMLNLDALREISINLEDFIGSICGQYTVLPPDLCHHHQQTCLLCDFNRSPRVGKIHSCNHITHVIEKSGGGTSHAPTMLNNNQPPPKDFWSLFSPLEIDECKDDQISLRTEKHDLLDFFTCDDQNMFMWVGCYGISSWTTINNTCEVTKRHAIAYHNNDLYHQQQDIKIDPHVTNLVELDQRHVLREANQRHRDFIHIKSQKIKQRIDDTMTVLKHDLITILAPSLMSDSIFDLLYCLKQCYGNRLEFLANIAEMEMWRPSDDNVSDVIAELCHVSLESKNMFELEENAFELVVSPRTWHLANRQNALPCRYAILANLEFTHNEEIIRGQLKHMCQYRDPRQRQPWNVGEALAHLQQFDHPTLIRYAFYARAVLLFYALKRIRGFDVKLCRPETCFIKKMTTKYTVYLNPADEIPAALFSDNCNNIYADDPSHIAVYLMKHGKL